MPRLSLAFLILLSGCGLKDLTLGELCTKRIVSRAVLASPTISAPRDCQRDAVCDVRIFDPKGEENMGMVAPESYSSGELSATVHTLRYNTASAIQDATDPSEYDRTEVACYFPSSNFRVEKTGRNSGAILAAAVLEISGKCLSGAN